MDASKLPPAVILDIDETVLDNSYYQARQVRDNSAFAAETWDRWCLEARATAIPGALEFTRDAEKRGVTVFYITNRAAKVEDGNAQKSRSPRLPAARGSRHGAHTR